ncbi:hypothetical protein [Oryzomonas rubra]|uniref:Uncharacterized protein n=1 Tax=Oryzomonas rubra TaxID=2509454 RepID=A0A5A9X811_9BACT|nr:hypothetical protein [Oryzomonas rubra]KAA0888793.1 hypothetical protein ET418_15550 [Oryzomonas rubra]
MAIEQERHRLMAEKLFVEVQQGRVHDDNDETFICDVRGLLTHGKILSEKRAAYLERLFEKY